MSNLSLGGGDETRPNLLSGAYGTVAAGGGSFAVLSAGGFVKLTPYETTKRAVQSAAAAGVVITVGGGISNSGGGNGSSSSPYDNDPFSGRPDREIGE